MSYASHPGISLVSKPQHWPLIGWHMFCQNYLHACVNNECSCEWIMTFLILVWVLISCQAQAPPPSVQLSNWSWTSLDERKRKGAKKRCLRFRPSFSLSSYSDPDKSSDHYTVVTMALIICSRGCNLTFYINGVLIGFTRRTHLYCYILTILAIHWFILVIW